MERKKIDKVNLEKRKTTFVLTGMVITLSIILAGFEWTNTPDKTDPTLRGTEIHFDVIQVKSIPREEQERKEILPEVRTDIKPVDEDFSEKDIFTWDPEVSPKTDYDFKYFPDDPVEKIDTPDDFYIVEEMPLFNGKDPNKEFPKFISKHLRYPEIAAENGVCGKVLVRFIVDQYGNVVNPSIVVSAHPDLDNEATRVVMSSPKWTPGKQRGKAVRVIYHFPIHFMLH